MLTSMLMRGGLSEHAIDGLARLASSKPEILAIYVFGSSVSGRSRPDSDIDVAVLLDPVFFGRLPLKYRADLIADAGEALETFAVNVVLLNDAPPALAYNATTKGKLIYERSRSARIAFQIRTLNLFLDMEPIHKIHVEYMKRRYLSGRVHG